jgi:hypothetical protein
MSPKRFGQGIVPRDAELALNALQVLLAMFIDAAGAG